MDSKLQELSYRGKELERLTAGLAHEINTPLGAIRASAGNILESMTESLNLMPEILQKIGPDNTRLFFEMIQTARGANGRLSSREERGLKRKLLASLETRQIAEAESVAKILAHMSLYENYEPYLELLNNYGEPVRSLAYNLTTVFKNGENISFAAEKANQTVMAINAFAGKTDNHKKGPVNLSEALETVLQVYHNAVKQGLNLTQDIPKKLITQGDENRLLEVLSLLMRDTLETTGGKGEITIRAAQMGENVRLEWGDSRGESFERSEEKSAERFALLKQIVEVEQSGKMFAETKDGLYFLVMTI